MLVGLTSPALTRLSRKDLCESDCVRRRELTQRLHTSTRIVDKDALDLLHEANVFPVPLVSLQARLTTAFTIKVL